MPLLSYNISKSLEDKLIEIEKIRRDLLLMPLSLKDSSRLKWESKIERVFFALSFEGTNIQKEEIAKLLTSPTKKHLKSTEKEALFYANTFGFLEYKWLVSDNTPDSDSVLNLYNIITPIKSKKEMKSFKKTRKKIDYLFEYLETGNLNPVIQSAIAYIQLLALSPFKKQSTKISMLTSYLLLYKNAYDFRGFLVLEKHFTNDMDNLQKAIKNVYEKRSLTPWLNYFSNSLFLQCREIIDKAGKKEFKLKQTHSLGELNERQKQILTFLERPGENITNKKVQKMFKISQITASRDLSKLTNLSLLFAHGKGRSVYYTRV